MTEDNINTEGEQPVRQAIRRIDDSERQDVNTSAETGSGAELDVTPAIRRVDDEFENNESESDDTERSYIDGEPVEPEDENPFVGDDPRSQVLSDVRDAFHTRTVDAPFEIPSDEFIGESFFDFSYLENRYEVERYWVNEPFAFVSIVYDDEAKEYRYHVSEPTLDTFEKYVRKDLVTLLRNSLMYFDFDEDSDTERERVFIENAKELIEEHAATVEAGTLHKVLYYLRRDFVHYGPIDAVMRDDGIEDISCDGIDVPVYVYHREYRDLRTNIRFKKQQLNSFTVRLAQQAGKQLSISNPLVDASLPDGSRIQLTMGGDVSTRGSNFTIRKFADIPYTPVDLINWNTFSLEQMAYFWLAIENNKSLVFAGGTGSGKTTSMNAISFFIPPASKVVTIEDTREIDLPHDNWIQSVTRSSASGEGRGEVSMYNLLQAALRQRPEYLVVGEIRTEQRVALTFFQAMGTGHTAYTTMHADSIETVLSRLQNPPLSVPVQMLQDLDIVSIQRQTFIGDRRVRRNAGTYELYAGEDNPNEIAINRVFEWDPANDVHERFGDSRVLAEVAHDRGWSATELAEELDRRQRVLAYLVENSISDYHSVAGVIHMYSKDPEFVIESIEEEALEPAELFDGVGVPADHPDHEVVEDDAESLSSTAVDEQTWKTLIRSAEHDAASASDGKDDVEDLEWFTHESDDETADDYQPVPEGNDD
ncbi:type II/IV secretion system ATPase subunit [Halorarius litoreus]|uniref:type II/IV secretion system ATPase subunit n=1 Tax=Halorarius litoreus TaxID=2962676 RepID=UPI0020CF5242|nr:type II/IV secretion system ATPase subunit [Halorarius litoreus]